MPESRTQTGVGSVARKEPGLVPWTTGLKELPWWALFLLLMGIALVYAIVTLPNYMDAFLFIVPGLKTTILVSLTAFAIALVTGLVFKTS